MILTESETKIIELMRADEYLQRIVLEIALQHQLNELQAEKEVLKDLKDDN